MKRNFFIHKGAIYLSVVAALFFMLIPSPVEGKKQSEARRLEVLFLGSPNSSHQPLQRFMTIRRSLGPRGINFTYFNYPTALTKENLAKYDALVVYGNHDVLEKDQEEALLDYSKNGGACVFLHSACGCFRNSDAFVKLLGAQFKSHGSGVFQVTIVNPEHPIMKGYKGFKCWDETYIHQKHNPDRTMLQKHEKEPWTWVRQNGKGRIFYTASGHDDRCWSQPQYQELIFRAINWTVGDEKAQLVKNLELPELTYHESSASIIHAKSWGEPLDRKVPHSHLQDPLPVEESLKLAQVPVDFELQVFASEPQVINPIAINWDEKGRMWVVEAYDYPNNKAENVSGQDKIKILEDTDNDGKADKVSTFATGLSICTSVLPYRDGCIATDGKDMVYFSDTDGDGKADSRKILFTGLEIWDTHACTSNLRYGFDNWIYATVGYTGFNVKIGDKQHKHRKGVFRFKPDGSQLEMLQNTSNNTWGLGFTEEGRIMGSTANNNPSWWVDVPISAYKKAGLKPTRTPRADSGDRIAPITFDTLQVDVKNGITAGAGHAIYTARLFPDDWHNKRVLICAPTSKLVAAPRLSRAGSGFKTTNFENNIYASADAWSAPVAAEIGPDGGVYIADWYNSIIQHNVYGPDQKKGKGNAYVTEHRDRKHGRIYRIVPKKAKSNPSPKFETPEQRIAALSHQNLFWRLTAQRKIIEIDGESAKESLIKEIAKDSIGAAHAINVLGFLGSNPKTYEVAAGLLVSKSGAGQVAAIKALPTDEKTAIILADKFSSLSPDAQQVSLVKIAHVSESPSIFKALKNLASYIDKDKSLKEAYTVALAIHDGLEPVVEEKPKAILSESAKRGRSIYRTASCIACHQGDGEGVGKTFPPLNKSERVNGNRTHAIKILLKGMIGPITVRGERYSGAMPAQEHLQDQEIADVLNYVRNSWDNRLGDITKEEVATVRESLKDRDRPFRERELK